MKAIDFFNPTPAERAWLRIELLRRAAQEYELAHNWPNAAECWAQAGDPHRAADLYLALNEPSLAAPQLLAAKRYAEAEPCYRTWLASAPTTDVLAQLTARLGLCAARLCAAQATGWRSELDQAEQAIAADYQAARQLLQDEYNRPALLAGQCWAALGHYGVTIGRPDLIQQGYELALARYGDQHPTERLRAARTYRTAIEWNHLLVADLDERLAHWQLAVAQPAWMRLRDEIERLGFRDGHHDVLHFADDNRQLAAWQKLAVLDHDPHQTAIDEYLRTLAPENMVYIPAGKFLMGTSEAEVPALIAEFGENNRQYIELELPQHELWLGGYYIGRYPVTNADYGEFIEAGGYQQQTFWAKAGWAQKQQENWTAPRYWNDAAYNSPQQPVVGVSWYEAVAYCTWRNGRLPTEAEWEKAASWDPVAQHKRRYPWGDELGEGNWIYRPTDWTPVGQISPGEANPYGVADMAGLYTWCNTRWTGFAYPYAAGDGREDLSGSDDILRVQRGGGSKPEYARCAYRVRFNPRSGLVIRGFRFIAPRCFLPF